MRAIDLLLRKRGARSVGLEGLLGISLVVLLGTIPLTAWALDAHLPVVLAVYNVLVVFGLVLPFCCAWDGPFLESLGRGRFLESVLLTALSPREWSDGLVAHALRSALPAALVVWLVTVCGGWASEIALWLPVVLCLTVTLSYIQQLRSVLAGNRWRQALAVLPLVVSELGLGWGLVTFSPLWTVQALGASAALLLATRVWLHRLLEARLRGPIRRPVRRGASLRPWSRNPITRLECWRQGWRLGPLGFWVWQAVRLVLLAGVVNGIQLSYLTVYDVPWVFLVTAGLSYVTVLSGLGRHSKDGLVSATSVTAQEYLKGWLLAVLPYRTAEAAVVFTLVALNTRPPFWAFVFACLAYLVSQCVAIHIAAMSAGDRNRDWAVRLGLPFLWLLLSGMLSMLVLIGVALITSPWLYSESYPTLALPALALVGGSMWVYRLSRHEAIRCLTDPDGILGLSAGRR